MTSMLRGRAISIAVLLLAGGLCGCTGSSSKSAGPSKTSTGGSASAEAGSGSDAQAQKLTQQYLSASAKPVVLASVKGKIRDGAGRDVAGTLDLLAVDAGVTSTAVRWRLSSNQPVDTVSSNYYNQSERTAPDTSEATLTAPTADLRLDSGIWYGTAPASQDCTCAWVPRSLGPDGVELSGLFPALPTAVTQIELRVPGFPKVSAAVSRK